MARWGTLLAAKKFHVHPVLVGSLGKDEEDDFFSNFKFAGICLFFLFWRYTVSWMYFWWPVMFNPDVFTNIVRYTSSMRYIHQLVASPRYLRALNGPCYKQDLFGPEPSNICNRFSGGPIVLSLESGVFPQEGG